MFFCLTFLLDLFYLFIYLFLWIGILNPRFIVLNFWGLLLVLALNF